MSLLRHPEQSVTSKWLYSIPCVIDGRVRIDTRSAWPTAILGLRAVRIEIREDFINFVIDNLEN